MGNLGFGGSTFPSIFMKTEKKKPNFIKTEKWKPVHFHSPSTQSNGDYVINSAKASEDEKRNTWSISCMDKKSFSKKGTHIFFEMENIPVVVTSSTFLHGSDNEFQHLPLGTILNVICQYENWLYVRTTHGHEGYIDCEFCLPLKASVTSLNATKADYEFDDALKSLYKWDFNGSVNYSERNVDMLYLQACGIRRRKQGISKLDDESKSIKLAVKNDFTSPENNTISVKKGDVVYLLHNRLNGWFWVKNEQGSEGLIPTAITGYVES